ncbi:MAG: ribbon-helix-helix domain-containing protein [Proteobacteria bacterium]|nr:ribbon-helix-helix domain-containing protein [Pseudomonadota bacterium]
MYKLHKHSITLRGHRTSFSLEDEFWNELKTLARRQKRPLQALIEEVDRGRKGNLSSALRVYVLKTLTNQD